MSLVYEALQKAEREKQRKTGIPLSPPPPAAPVEVQPAPAAKSTHSTPTPVPAPSKSHQGLLVAAILSVSVVAIVAIVVIVSRLMAEPHSRDVKAPGETQLTTAVAPAEATAPATQPDTNPTAETSVTPETPPLKLTGIAPLPDGKFCAFFADRPLPAYEEQQINGVTIKKIEQDRVTLILNGKEIVLRLF